MPFNILRTESKSDLAKLLADVAGLAPTDFIERELVNDVAYHTWEIRRVERVKTGIQNNALPRALARVLNGILLPPSEARADECLRSSLKQSYWWMIDPVTKRRIASQLEEAGLDGSAIEAEATRLVADDLEKVNQMLKFARDGRDKAFRSIAKYRKSLAGQIRLESDRVLAVDQAPSVADDEEK